jgi:hypothetical protein
MKTIAFEDNTYTNRNYTISKLINPIFRKKKNQRFLNWTNSG